MQEKLFVTTKTKTFQQRVRQALDQCRGELLSERTDDGYWLGELAGSALGTATAISAMSAVLVKCDDQGETLESGLEDAGLLHQLIGRGLDYLRGQQNNDGGFGDTDRSHSNIATSYLVLAASTLAKQSIDQSIDENQLSALRGYIDAAGGIDGLRRRYGKDKTFVVPILCNMAIAGLVPWNDVQALPFEAAVFPQSMYRFMQMPVVSYAIPALVAIGQARHMLGKQSMIPLRWVRAASVKRTMDVLQRMQPDSGGYLEATPLTSFVVMSLAATGRGDCEVSRKGLKFLCDSIREDGSWPIDTNLATWVTSLSMHALACDPQDDGSWCTESLVDWHLGCQHHVRHPFTGADPGGWGWTDLSGAVPDSDDTPGAILALRAARKWCSEAKQMQIDRAIEAGKKWLCGLQNRNGGWPTFCRGWGKLPFDRSSTDLTAHALRAFGDTIDEKRKRKALRFLAKQQCDDGSWLPLWFGNQDLADETNPVYGTSRVLLADVDDDSSIQRACDFLIQSQNADGGWGGGESLKPKLERLPQDFSVKTPDDLVSSVEETALAVEALSTFVCKQRDSGVVWGVKSVLDAGSDAGESAELGQIERRQFGHSGESVAAGGKNDLGAAIIAGVEYLLRSVDDERHRVPWPIGFYFAKLWYHERLYPLVFATAALGKYLRATADEHDPNWPR